MLDNLPVIAVDGYTKMSDDNMTITMTPDSQVFSKFKSLEDIVTMSELDENSEAW
jgi:hypothetical protein